MAFKFEQLEIWKLARQFAGQIYTITKRFPKEELFSLTSQTRRASLSVLLNIAEGADRGSDPDFARFLTIAYGSLHEVISALYIALDQKYIDKPTFDAVYIQSTTLSKKIYSLIQYLRQ